MLPPNIFRQRGHQEADHDHGAAEAHAEDDVVGEALADVLRPLYQHGRRESQERHEQTYGCAPSG